MEDQIKIGLGEVGGMGDLLCLTPICRHAYPIVEIKSQYKNFSCIFNNIADVKIVENPVHVQHDDNEHYCISNLRACGFSCDEWMPFIKLSDCEIEIALKELDGIDNPIVFCPNTSIKWKQIREFDHCKFQKIIDSVSEKYSVLQFGMPNNFSDFKNITKKFCGIGVREEASIFSVVKKYIGVNTGDMHLMVACGGKVNVLTPHSSNVFKRNKWEYPFPYGTYTLFDEYGDFLNNL